jgi:hypothetical protein
LLGALTVSAATIPLVVVVPAMLEELGWRGFAVQSAADDGRSPAWAAAVVGLIFVALHVPLYFPGQLYHGLPWWPLPIILLASSVLMTWIYLRTGSALLAGTPAPKSPRAVSSTPGCAGRPEASGPLRSCTQRSTRPWAAGARRW